MCHVQGSHIWFCSFAKKNVKTNVCKSNGVTLRYKCPMLRNIKGGYFIIVAEKKEILNHNSNIIILDGSGQCSGTIDDHYQPSGKLLLLVARLKAHNMQSEYSWGHMEAKFLKQCKESVIKKNTNHFGSRGQYYSFGNKANFAIVNNSSVSQYVSKKFSKQKRTEVA